MINVVLDARSVTEVNKFEVRQKCFCTRDAIHCRKRVCG